MRISRRYARAGLRRVPLLAVAAILAGCSSGGGLLGSSSAGAQSSGPSTIGLHDLIHGPPPVKNAGETGGEIDCPKLDIRQGASTMVMTAPGGDGDPMKVRYQVTIARGARECTLQGSTLTMKVGLQGRVVLGPAGSPGETTVPVRYALVKESVGDTKTVYSQLFLIPVTIGPGQTAVDFSHVDSAVTATVAKNDLDDYVMYMGFDPQGVATPDQKKRKPAPPKRAKTN